MITHSFIRLSVCVLLASAVAPVCAAKSEEVGVGDTVLLVEELEFALEVAHQRISELREQLAEHEGGDSPMAAALAAANREADQYRIRYRDLLVRVEALGLEALQSEKALQERLIKAVRERQQFQEQQDALAQQLFALSESVLAFSQQATSADAEARMRLEGELRRADEVLGLRPTSPSFLAEEKREVHDGKVVSYKADLALAVVNVGRRSGVRVGMPLNVYRKDRLIGTALVVDVREDISGAIVQGVFQDGDQVQVRDRIELRTANSIRL